MKQQLERALTAITDRVLVTTYSIRPRHISRKIEKEMGYTRKGKRTFRRFFIANYYSLYAEHLDNQIETLDRQRRGKNKLAKGFWDRVYQTTKQIDQKSRRADRYDRIAAILERDNRPPLPIPERQFPLRAEDYRVVAMFMSQKVVSGRLSFTPRKILEGSLILTAADIKRGDLIAKLTPEKEVLVRRRTPSSSMSKSRVA